MKIEVGKKYRDQWSADSVWLVIYEFDDKAIVQTFPEVIEKDSHDFICMNQKSGMLGWVGDDGLGLNHSAQEELELVEEIEERPAPQFDSEMWERTRGTVFTLRDKSEMAWRCAQSENYERTLDRQLDNAWEKCRALYNELLDLMYERENADCIEIMRKAQSLVDIEAKYKNLLVNPPPSVANQMLLDEYANMVGAIQQYRGRT